MARTVRKTNTTPRLRCWPRFFRPPQGGDAGGGAIFPAVAADKSDQPGVLGNLPRSRPGQRSQKRSGAQRAAQATRSKPAARSGPAVKRKAATARKKAAARTRKPAAAARTREPAAAAAPRPPRRAPEPASKPPDPITFAFRTAGKVAEVGLKTAGGLLRRLPGR
jgi:hypothetical protein